MTTLLKPDLCVIGAGESGLAVAIGAAALGVPTVLVERGETGGARRALRSAALIAAAARAQAVRTAREFGVVTGQPKTDVAALRAHIEAAATALAANHAPARLAALGISLIRGEATFADPRTVEAAGAAIRPRRFVIATGSQAVLPAIEGLGGVPVLTADTVFALKDMPKRLLLLGDGAEALELAQAFRRLGSEVTLIAEGALLPSEEAELSEPVLVALRREGVVIHAATTVRRVETVAKGLRLHLTGEGGDGMVAGTHLLIAGGRAAAIEGLDLPAARIALDGAHIRTGPGLRTTNRHVYAIGGAARPEGGHSAAGQAGVVLRGLMLRLPAREQVHHVPRAIRTSPAIARVGLDEAAARKAAGAIRIFRWPFQQIDRAHAEGVAEGHIKVVTDRRGRVLGAAIVGHGADELILPWAGFARRRALLSEALALTAAHPAMGDIARAAAVPLVSSGLTKPRVQRIIRFLRNLG